MDERERRLAENQALFRDVNERVHEISVHWSRGQLDEPFRIVCECARVDCSELLEVTPALYQRVRASGSRFLVAPGHEIAEVERVVEQTPTLAVVEKTGEAKAYAEELDRRRRSPEG